jgi:hypothetical protein
VQDDGGRPDDGSGIVAAVSLEEALEALGLGAERREPARRGRRPHASGLDDTLPGDLVSPFARR